MASIENIRSTSDMDDPSRKGGVAVEVLEEEPTSEYESIKYIKLHNKLKEWFDQEWERQAANRYQMAMDEDYYDAMQWTEDEAAELMNRGQAPLVYNEIKPTIDWMIGTERRTRIDYKVLPRKKEGSKDAENKSKLLKYLSDTNKTVFHRSAAFADAVKAGVGWLESGIKGDDTDELLYTRKEDWRKVLHDSTSIEPDISDARYLFRWKWLDMDIAEVYFPESLEMLQMAGTDGLQLNGIDVDEDETWYLGARVTAPGQDFSSASVGKYSPYNGSAYTRSTRERVKLIEAWYRMPVKKQYFADGDLYKTAFDPKSQQHQAALDGGYSLHDKIVMEIRCCIFTSKGIVFDGPSPYEHNRFPLVPVWCYRRKRDNAPYGAIRNLRDPQDDINKRASKALWILSTNQIIAETGAVDDWDELREEAARADGIIVKNTGKFLEMNRDVALAETHLKLMDRGSQHIRNVGGVTAENLGRETNANSGKAITARQDQGGVVTTEPFDNYRFALQLVGEIELSNIEQFYTEEKAVRIVGDKGNAKFINLNQADPETGKLLNDVTEFQADYVVSEQDYRSSLRQAMFESLFEIVGRIAQMNPQAALNMLDMVVELADLPNKDALVERIRQLNGQTDPDVELEPEEQAAQDAQKQATDAITQKQQEINMASMEAQLQELLAKGDAMGASAILKRVEAMYAALQAAGVVATNPAAAVIADGIMKGSGFQDAQQVDTAQLIDQAAQQIPPEEQQAIQARQQPGAQQSALSGVTRGIETPTLEDGAM